mgnify:CR=1 FL=1
MRAELIKTRTGFLPVNRSTETLQLMQEDYHNPETAILLPEIVFITSYPPRECGIATYSQDLVKAMHNKFKNSFSIQICPLESDHEKHIYTGDIKYKLNTDHPNEFIRLAHNLNDNDNIRMVVIQHEFGFFEKKGGNFKQFLNTLTKPVVLVFHTVLPKPDALFKNVFRALQVLPKPLL